MGFLTSKSHSHSCINDEFAADNLLYFSPEPGEKMAISIEEQKRLILAWKDRFKSFRAGSFKEVEKLASTPAGRGILSGAIAKLIDEVPLVENPDLSMFAMIGRELPKLWPNDTAAPTLKVGHPNEFQKYAIEVVLSGFEAAGNFKTDQISTTRKLG